MKVSVVIPTYNHAHYIDKTIQSVIEQSYKDIEIIVVDDCSIDNTPEVLRRFAGVKYVRLDKRFGGAAKARNAGIKAATGELVALIDSDDLMLPGKIEKQVGALKREGAKFCFSNFYNFSSSGISKNDFLSDHYDFHKMEKEKIGDNSFRIERKRSFSVLTKDNYIGTSGLVFRKEIVDEIGGFDTELKNSDDVHFFFRMTERYDGVYIDECLHLRRIHENNISSRPIALRGQFLARKKTLREIKGIRLMDKIYLLIKMFRIWRCADRSKIVDCFFCLGDGCNICNGAGRIRQKALFQEIKNQP